MSFGYWGLHTAANPSGEYTRDQVWPGANQEPDLHLHPAELRAYARKGNRYSPKTLNNLKRDIAQDGVLQPVTIQTDGKKAAIADGHHRVMAALALGLDSVPVWVEHDRYAEGRGVQGGLADWISGGGQPREPGWNLEPDGIRYAHLVEADVAEDLRRLAMPAPLPQGIRFRYHPELVWSPGVTAHAPGGKQIGSLEWYDDDHVMVDLGTRQPGEIDRIQVPEDHRGQSIATSMFDFAKQHEPRLHHSDRLTPDGEGWSAYEQSRHARLV